MEKKAILIGYRTSSREYKFLDLQTGKVIVPREDLFEEKSNFNFSRLSENQVYSIQVCFSRDMSKQPENLISVI